MILNNRSHQPHRALTSPRAASELWRAFLSCLLVISLLFAPTVAAAQDHAPTPAANAQPAATNYSGDQAFFSLEHRQQLYEESRLSKTDATLKNLLLPGLGNIYTEQYFYAGIALSFMVFTLSFIGYGLVTDQSEFLWFGAATAGLAYGGSIATSIVGVDQYNRRLRQGLKIDAAKTQQTSPLDPAPLNTAQLTWRF